jgi:hypothetical protein
MRSGQRTSDSESQWGSRSATSAVHKPEEPEESQRRSAATRASIPPLATGEQARLPGRGKRGAPITGTPRCFGRTRDQGFQLGSLRPAE